jgi:amidase
MGTGSKELAFTPATEQAALLRARAIKAVELVNLYLERIDALNPSLDAYLTVCGERARAEAAAVDEARARGDDSPPFAGVPIAIKDLTDTAGVRTTHGTQEWCERVPNTDAEVVTRIKAAGFVMLGKTNVPEFGKSVLSESPGYPPARNPWDPSRTPGGSSGGAGAAVAAGLCAVAHGSDSGGSIRIPAALCGVVGLKPTRGRVSEAPRPSLLYTMQGPLARTVLDAAALLDAMTGPAPGDEWWAPPPARPYADEVGRDPGRLRVALTTEPFLAGVEVDHGVVAATEAVAELLEKLGHSVESAAPPWDPVTAEAAAPSVFAAEAAADAAEPGYPTTESLDLPQRVLVMLGQGVTGAAYVAAHRTLHALAREVHRFFAGFDVLLTPTVPIPALPVGAFDVGDGDAPPDQMEALMRSRVLAAFTAFANLTGTPAVTLPLSTGADGLPVGAHFVSGLAREDVLVRLAAQLETAWPWRDRTPPVA